MRSGATCDLPYGHAAMLLLIDRSKVTGPYVKYAQAFRNVFFLNLLLNIQFSYGLE